MRTKSMDKTLNRRHGISLAILTAISRWSWVSQYQNVSILDFIGAKDDGSGDNWSYKTYKAPVKSSPSTNQHPVKMKISVYVLDCCTCPHYSQDFYVHSEHLMYTCQFWPDNNRQCGRGRLLYDTRISDGCTIRRVTDTRSSREFLNASDRL